MTQQNHKSDKGGAGASADRQAAERDPGVPAVAGTPPVNDADTKRDASDDKTAKGWLRRRARKPLLWVVVTVIGGALAAWGAQLENAGSGAIHGLTADHQRKTDTNAAKTPPLGVNTAVSYDDQLAVSLAKPLQAGPGYTQLLQGIIDNGYGSGWGPFLAANDGAPVHELHVDLYLTGQSATPVRVTNIRIQLTGPPRPRFTGTYIPIPHAGGQAAFRFTSRLDSASPVIVGVQGQQSFPDFNVTLTSNEQATVSIDFFAVRYTYSWILEVDYLQGTRQHTLRVTGPGGKPFLLTSLASRYGAVYATNYPAPGYRLVPGEHTWRQP
jgi:hypothetical protein